MVTVQWPLAPSVSRDATTDLTNNLKSFKLYRPQYTDVKLLTGNNPTDVSINQEYRTNSTIKIIATLDWSAGQSGWLLMYVDGESVDPITSGSYYQIYEVQPTVQSVTFRYPLNAGFLFSVFQWVSSPDYFLWGMHETSNVDIGGVYTVPGGFGIPTGTIVFSTHPPDYREESEMYHGSSTSSLPSSKQRVRFNPDGTPRGVLKNGQEPVHYRD